MVYLNTFVGSGFRLHQESIYFFQGLPQCRVSPKPQTPNPKPQTLNPKPYTLNPKPYLSIPRSIKNCPIEEAGKIQPRKKSVRFNDGQKHISWWKPDTHTILQKKWPFQKSVLLLGLRWVLGTLSFFPTFFQQSTDSVRFTFFWATPPPPKKKKKTNKTQHYVGKTLGSEYAFLCSAQVTYSLVHKTLHRAREGSPELRRFP